VSFHSHCISPLLYVNLAHPRALYLWLIDSTLQQEWGIPVTGTEDFNQDVTFTQNQTQREVRLEISFRLAVIQRAAVKSILKIQSRFVHANPEALWAHFLILIYSSLQTETIRGTYK
jgi:hypothetical protein